MSGATSAAIIGGAALGAGATIYSSNQAASAQEKSAQNATNAQMQMFDVTQQNLQPYNQLGQSQFNPLTASTANYQPYINSGANAANMITGLEGGTGTGVPSASNIQSTLQSLPGYQFALQQGLQTTQNSAAAQGLGNSGAAIKAADQYSTGLANQYYNNLLTGLQNTAGQGLNAAGGLTGSLQNIVNTGGNAAAGVGNAAVQTGANVGSNIVGAGNAAAAADISGGSAVGNFGNSLGTASILNNLNQNGIYGPGVSTPPQQSPAPVSYADPNFGLIG